MSDHPTTFRGESPDSKGIAWEDRADLHRVGDGDGVFDKAKTLRSGTLAEIIQHMMLLPEDERRDYEIMKAGDSKISADEAAKLASRPDFPRE